LQVLSLELESMDLTRRGLMAKVELALKERQHLMEQHQWELNLLRENLSLEVASTDSLSAEMEAMLQQKRDLVFVSSSSGSSSSSIVFINNSNDERCGRT
jgi:hypothetical protein